VPDDDGISEGSHIAVWMDSKQLGSKEPVAHEINILAKRPHISFAFVGCVTIIKA
jgi:hypothetical protein